MTVFSAQLISSDLRKIILLVLELAEFYTPRVPQLKGRSEHEFRAATIVRYVSAFSAE